MLNRIAAREKYRGRQWHSRGRQSWAALVPTATVAEFFILNGESRFVVNYSDTISTDTHIDQLVISLP